MNIEEKKNRIQNALQELKEEKDYQKKYWKTITFLKECGVDEKIYLNKATFNELYIQGYSQLISCLKVFDVDVKQNGEVIISSDLCKVQPQHYFEEIDGATAFLKVSNGELIFEATYPRDWFRQAASNETINVKSYTFNRLELVLTEPAIENDEHYQFDVRSRRIHYALSNYSFLRNRDDSNTLGNGEEIISQYDQYGLERYRQENHFSNAPNIGFYNFTENEFKEQIPYLIHTLHPKTVDIKSIEPWWPSEKSGFLDRQKIIKRPEVDVVQLSKWDKETSRFEVSYMLAEANSIISDDYLSFNDREDLEKVREYRRESGWYDQIFISNKIFEHEKDVFLEELKFTKDIQKGQHSV